MEHVFTLFPRLAERRTQKAGTMSGGEQQMCAIGRAMMARPRLLMLDEPSMGLAPIFVDRIFETIVEINKEGTPILLVEQNALMALDVADRGYVLQTGTIVLEGPAKDLKTNERGPQDVPRRGLARRRRLRLRRRALPETSSGAYGGASRTPTRARPPATPCAISSALAIEWLGTKPSARAAIASRQPGDDDAAEPGEHGRTASPVRVGEERVARLARAVCGERLLIRGRRSLGLDEVVVAPAWPRIAGGTGPVSRAGTRA